MREAETNAFIVDRVKAALDVNKACATEEQRREYLTGLAYVAPPRLASRDKAGMIRRVAERLNVRRGRRSRKQGGRQTAFDRAIDRRTNFDAAALQLLGPLGHVFTEGQKVLTHNGPAEIARLTADGRVVVTYRNGDSYAERTYTSRSGKEPGSARLQPMPPSLLPAPRATSALATSDTTKKAIVDHAHVYCPTSPHQRDVMKRRTGPCTVEEKAALILSDVREAMFADFQEKHPEIKISFSQWKETLKTEVWNMKKAYRSTCLDRVDVNYKWHRETLLVVATMLAIEMEPPQQDADADDREEQPPDALTWHRIGADPPTAVADVDDNAIGEELVNETLAALLTKQTRLTEAEWASCGIAKLHSHHYIKAGDSYFRPAPSLEKQLIEFASLTLMSQVGNALVCSECLGDETADDCLHDRCDRCSFRRIWSNGIRKRIEPDDEFWAQEISWDMLKPGGDSTHGSSDNELRHTVTGTLIDFLDAFEPVQGNWKPHRFHAVQAKVAERELEQNLTPKKLKKDTDWSENGELIVKDQVQSEYWHLKYYSLLITITAFLVTADWEDRESALPAKAEVTVQPEWAVPSEGAPHVTYIKGSFYGTVETGSKSTGEGIEYTVVCNDGSRVVVPRCRLRHRVWHRVAFLGITNEKQHVGLTTQAFHTEELEFWRCWHESGRDAALAYAAADRAAWPSLVPDAEPQTAKGRAAATRATRRAAATAAATATTAAAAVANPAIPPCAAAAGTRAVATSKPTLAADLARLDDEQFWALVGHADNATHLKSSANLHYWSNKQDEMSSLNFLKQIMAEYGCPGKGKGPWDGLGAAVKTRIRNAIINEIARKAQTTPSGQITNAIEVAQHLRAIFSTPDWLLKHAHMKINEYVVFYIDKDEFVWPAGDPPIYSTFEGISKRYSFLMRGGGRVGGARYCCWCPACCLAFETGEGMDALLDVAACERRHLMRYEHRGGARFGYEEATITCTQAAGVGNSKVRAKALWRELKPLLKAGKFAAVEARVLWGLEEQVHMRPGHFWACELGNADGKGSPILQGPFKKQQWWPPVEGEAGWKPEYAGIPRYRYDEGECAILLRCYFHRTADDREGLTFLRWPGKAGEKLVINSSELRAVQGRQECDFKLMLPQGSPQLRQQQSRAKKQKRPQQEAPPIDPKQRWRLERDLDRDTRRVCEAT